MNRQDFKIIAHRGAAGEAPENTLAAFALGMKQGATGIELDVHLSKDGEIIVCHDTTLNRTTDRQGAISEMTVAEIKQADAGRWFHESFQGERIPLLEEVLDLVPPSVDINVEIKAGLKELVPPLAELLKRKDRVGSVFVSSFDFECLEQLNALVPDVRLALLYNIRMTNQHRMADLLDCPVYSLHPHWSVLNKHNVQAATSRGLKVYPWTVNKEEGMRSMIDCGVSGIITDFPGRLKQILEN
ncbi:MAG: glycerophosphoryl diester phosphodiesterase [Paenibacillus sp.]|nr:glycerophosphoryl diester phosphodiesterase [Paenibacillus sp.]